MENKEIRRIKHGKDVRFPVVYIEEWLAGQLGSFEQATFDTIVRFFQGRPITRSGIARMLRIWYRDTEGLPLDPYALTEALCAD